MANVRKLPEIVVLGPPSVFRIYEKEFCSRFRVLLPCESPLPLPQFLAAEAQSIQAVFTSGSFPLTADVLRNLPSLRVVVTSSVGVDNIDLAECQLRGIAVSNAGERFSTDVADLAMGLLLNVLWKISAGNRCVKKGIRPNPIGLGLGLGGKQIGIVGLGNIGLEVAKRLEAFGCSILYFSRNKKPSVAYAFYQDICELAAASDILIVCCALTEETHHLINRDVILALGKEGVIVNIARGAVVDEKELVRCLQQGEIGGAGLDVFENEPNVPMELLELDNVVLSPHVAVFTEESFRDSYELICANFDAFFANTPLLTQVFG